MNKLTNIILWLWLTANLSLASETIIWETNKQILNSLQDKSLGSKKVESNLWLKLYNTEWKFNKDVKNTIVLVASQIDKIKPDWIVWSVTPNWQVRISAQFKF